jgi:hypothetical protein
MLTLILTIAIVGLVVWFITTYIPMPAAFRTAIIAIAALFLLLYVLGAFGLIDSRHWRLR